MSTVAEIAVSYATKGAQSAVQADRNVRDSIQDTAKTAQSEAGTIDRWMERHKSAIQAIGVATAGALGSILAASPTMRAELSSARIAFSLFADTIINDVLPPGESLADVMFDLEESYNDLPDPIRNATSSMILFGSAAALATIAVGPVAGVLLVAVGGFMALSQAINPTIGLLAATIILAGALFVVVGPLAAAIMLVTGGFVALSTVIGRANTLILAGAAAAGIAASALGVLSLPVVALIGLVALLALAWQNNWLGIRDITMSIVSAISGAISWMGDFIYADMDERLEMIKDLWRGFRDWVSGIGESAAHSVTNAWNDIIPSSVSLPSVDIAGETYGGGSISLPRLRHGGSVERGGLARLHAGERVVPAAEVSSSDGGGGGGTTIVNVEQHIESGGSPRRTADKSAEAVSQTIQDEFGMRR